MIFIDQIVLTNTWIFVYFPCLFENGHKNMDIIFQKQDRIG